MNLLNLTEACENRTGFNDPDYRPTWRSFINEAIREFSRKYPWPGLEDLITVSADGTSHYLVLPHFVGDIVAILNETQNNAVDRGGDWDREIPAIYAQRTGGRVVQYDDVGKVPALADPTGYVYFKGDESGDGSWGQVYVTGYINNSGASGTSLQRTLKTASVNMNGLSPVTLPNQFASFVSISKVTDTNGDFYFYDAGNSDKHISWLGRFEDEANFKRIQMMFKPAAETLLRIRYRHKIPPLKANEQSPHPSVDADFVTREAVNYHWRSQHQFTKAQIERGDAVATVQDVINKELNFNEPFSQIIPWREPRDPALD